ncbi:MAG TPA: LPS export ABC transporter periplasmic protein LptC [Cyanothece sp. UBA12306]|nr:LPS export ABC transporter periplasmic protein LptC [Cyanothece sp. UBA12306]
MNRPTDLEKFYLWPNRVLRGGVFFLLLFLIVSCQGSEQSQNNDNNNPEKAPTESRLILNNSTLEQSNAQGQILWKVQANETAYSPDRKKAKLTAVKGNIFQDGQIVLRVKADQGQINRDGQEILLKKNVVAVDPRNNAVVRSEEVEWRPQESVLIIRKNLRGSHPQLEASAQEGKYYPKKQKFELSGKIIATSKNPRLQLKTEHLVWQVPQNKVIGDRLLKMVRFQGKTITDQLMAKRAQVHLKTKQVIIQENIEFKSLKPPLQVATDEIIWKYKIRQVTSNKPVKLINYEQGITIIGNEAQVDLARNMAYLRRGVKGSSTSNQAKLYSNDLTWNINDQTIEALGNVIYEQTTSPKFNLTGEKAVGTLNNNNIVVSGNTQDRVVTEIFPE